MHLAHGLHLAYCTNIHRGESWPETLRALKTHTLAVRDRVAAGAPYAIGLRLSALAAQQLSDPATLREFQRWLESENCYVFTINGFPFGQFHGTRVKEQVYVPDWTSQERLRYTKQLFDLLAAIVPAGISGSVSTVPGSFKEFIHSEGQVLAMCHTLWDCIEHIARLSEQTSRDLHLGLEPEPLCYLETSQESVDFFERLRQMRPSDDRLERHLGITYDTCHLAVEYEEANAALGRLIEHQVRISKIHLSSALRVSPSADIRAALGRFADDTYLHQVIERDPRGGLRRYRDLDHALAAPRPDSDAAAGNEWRIHYHIPLHVDPAGGFHSTSEHLLGVLDVLKLRPELCSHLEMETYTWDVLPPELKQRDVVDQLVSEYSWTLGQLAARGIARGVAPTA
jgi:sugar phosphate isomerase/epimerase